MWWQIPDHHLYMIHTLKTFLQDFPVILELPENIEEIFEEMFSIPDA